VTVRVGVVGTGNMGADHVDHLHQGVSGAAVGAVADVDAARARAVAERAPGAKVADDALALIADPAVDAVVIASHDSTHAELVRACLAAGKPVLCEKPLAPTLAECVEIVGAETQALISVGFMRRFDPGYAELKAAVQAATLGAPLLLHCVSRGMSAGPATTSEYSVTGASIHEFDIVPWLLGSPITEVSWHAPRSSSAISGLQDPQLTLLRTADGALTTVETFLNARYGYDVTCEIVCEQGTLALAPVGRVVTNHARTRSLVHAADWRPRFADAYRIELQAWVDAVAAGRPSPLASARDGLVATAIAEAVIASMHDGGRSVAVEVPG
jgi:myo-inositol 2-dehydrogenase / D-chiro-inositol 1-dehydrogenase